LSFNATARHKNSRIRESNQFLRWNGALYVPRKAQVLLPVSGLLGSLLGLVGEMLGGERVDKDTGHGDGGADDALQVMSVWCKPGSPASVKEGGLGSRVFGFRVCAE
jgi:hypothetical protein